MNLPWALLVEGDIIVLRPGQEVPGHCKGLNQDDPELFFGQVFQSQSQVCNSYFQQRKNYSKRYIMYINRLVVG